MGAGLPHKTIAGPISSAQMKAVSRGTSSPSIHQSRLKPPENCDFVWCFLEKRAPVPYLATGTSRCLVGPPRQPHCNPILSAHIIAVSCGGCPPNKKCPPWKPSQGTNSLGTSSESWCGPAPRRQRAQFARDFLTIAFCVHGVPPTVILLVLSISSV